MLSKKMTFSLMSLITLLAFAFVAPFATAGVLGDKFATTITLESGTEVLGMLVGDNQITPGSGATTIRVVFAKGVATGDNAVAATADVTGIPAGLFAPEDVKVVAFNKLTGTSIVLGPLDPAPAFGSASASPATDSKTEFTVALHNGPLAEDTVVLVTIAEGAVTNNDPADAIAAGTGDDTLGGNAKATLQFDVVAVVAGRPSVISVTDLPGAVIAPGNPDSFTFTVTLSEKPKEFKKGHIDPSGNATIDTDPVALAAIAEPAVDGNADGLSTEESDRLYPYLVTIKPKYESKDDIVIKIKSFENLDTPTALKSLVSMGYVVKVLSDASKKVGLSGTKKDLPKDIIIPADGYLVVPKTGDSLVVNPGDPKKGAADIARRDKANTQTYNMQALDLGVDLEGFLIRGGTIDLIAPATGLVISEIMWGTDGGDAKRQWIEIANTSGGEIKTAEEKADTDAYEATAFILYEASETVPDMTDATLNIQDRMSTLYRGTNHWSIAGKGQSGRTDEIIRETVGDAATDLDIDIEVVATARLISMQRAVDAAGAYADGTMASSWSQSTAPSQNFVDAAGGLLVGSPGTAPLTPVEIVPVEPEPDPVAVAMPEDIMITEIMVDTGGGRLPQWIELTNVSGAEVSVAGWSVQITNDAADDEVIGGSVGIDLSGTLGVGGGEDLGGTLGKSLLLVAGEGRSSANLAGNARVIDVSSQLDQKGRYVLISSMSFKIALIPPQETGVLKYGDEAGNLGEGWELPMSEDGRSSLIRRELLADGMATLGTAADGWILADTTGLITGATTWYGSDEDAGTPGYDGGGPLPVQLSHFRPARDRDTGAAVITWSTQSELNNAGFFIKRSQQRDGQFKVINAAMIQGAGTISEKQFYTYTDTTAQPNVVYYYQIEDVSLDGNRQTLTNGIRLKGHIGAAGKLTTTWGDLKTLQ